MKVEVVRSYASESPQVQFVGRSPETLLCHKPAQLQLARKYHEPSSTSLNFQSTLLAKPSLERAQMPKLLADRGETPKPYSIDCNWVGLETP